MHNKTHMELIERTINDICTHHVINGILDMKAVDHLYKLMEIKKIMMKMEHAHHDMPKKPDDYYGVPR